MTITALYYVQIWVWKEGVLKPLFIFVLFWRLKSICLVAWTTTILQSISSSSSCTSYDVTQPIAKCIWFCSLSRFYIYLYFGSGAYSADTFWAYIGAILPSMPVYLNRNEKCLFPVDKGIDLVHSLAVPATSDDFKGISAAETIRNNTKE